MEGLIFGGTYLQREICVSKSIGLALKFEVNLLFCFVLLCFTLYLRASPSGAYIWKGDLTEGFLHFRFRGAYIWRGLYMKGLIFGILRYLSYVIQRGVYTDVSYGDKGAH